MPDVRLLQTHPAMIQEDLPALHAELRRLVDTLDSSLHAVAWLSKTRDAIVVCPQGMTGRNGVLFEAGPATVLPYETTSDEHLGLSLLEALRLFAIQATDLRRDQAHWPAFLASRAKSQNDFRTQYLSAQVTLARASTRVEVMPEGQFNISVVGYLGFPEPGLLGGRVFHAYHCCRLLREQGLLT